MKLRDVRRLLTIAMLLIVVVFFAITADSFLAPRNISMILKDAAYVGLVALGASFVVVNGGVDLSGSGIICFAAMITARIANISGMPGIVAVLAGTIVGAACGVLNAGIVLKLKLSDFVTTIATGSIFSGLALMCAFRENGRIISVALKNKSFLVFGKGIGGVYYIAIAWIVFTVIMQYVLKRTKFGLYVVAMGSNQKSASMSGVNCGRLKLATFVIGGAFAGLAATLFVANSAGTSIAVGTGVAFQAVAACVVGGMVLGGGKGDPVSALLGSLLITIVTNGLRKFGLSTAGVDVFYGVVILAAMLLDSFLNTLRRKAVKRI